MRDAAIGLVILLLLVNCVSAQDLAWPMFWVRAWFSEWFRIDLPAFS
jgi:hypothetical protein